MQSVRFALVVLVILPACTGLPAANVERAALERAEVPMRDASGRDLGTLTLTNAPGGLMLTGGVRGLPPGTHGIHVHTTGRCEPTFESAGPHWNPMSRQHGTLNPQGPHLGDMPNISVSSDSSAAASVMTPGGTLRGADALLDADGAAVVIHANADDYRTDPSGNSGSRIACGVVRGR
jgi:Cu-Zn family superoxide dismutase